jgi:hypothetical protein
MASPAGRAASGGTGRHGGAPEARLARLCPLLAGLAALVVYVATLAPTIGFGDSPELSAAARALGVPHPTGYPLLMLLGHGFSALVPWGDPAWRLNLLGAGITSGSVALAAAFVQGLTGRAVAGWVSGLALAFCPVVWDSADLFEVYGLHLLFVTGLLVLWLRFARAPGDGRLRALTFTAGLAATHHLMIGLILPVLGVAVLRHARRLARPGELLRLLVLFALPFSVLFYLPLAALSDPMVNWGDPDSPLRFWSHVTARQYHGMVGGDASLPAWQPALAYLRDTWAGLTPVLFVLAAVGLVASLLGHGTRAQGEGPGRDAAFVISTIGAIGFGFGSLYDVVDREPFFLNATLALALLSGVGVAAGLDLLAAHRPALVAVTATVCALLPALPLVAHYSENDRSGDYEAHDRALAILHVLPPDAVLLVQGIEGYPAVYASLMEGIRPDVLVVDHYLRIRGDGGGYGPELERLRHTPGLDPDRFILTVTAVAAGLGRPLFLVPGVPDFDWEEIGLVRVRRGLVDQLVARDAGRLPVVERPDAPLAAFREGPVLWAARIGEERVEAGDPTRVELEWSWPAGVTPHPSSVVIVAADEAGRPVESASGAPVLAHTHPLGQGIEEEAVDAAPWRESIALLLPRALPVGATQLFLALQRDGGFEPTRDERVFVRLGELYIEPRTRAAWVPLPRSAADATAARVAAAGDAH